jgi:hypothetical protein
VSRRQVDDHSRRRVAVIRGVAAVTAIEDVGAIAPLQNVVAAVAKDPVVAAEAEDRVGVVRHAVEPPIENIGTVGSKDFGHRGVAPR